MGALMTWIRSFWQTEMEISIIGLENAGKSTFVNVLNGNDFVPNMAPTVGFNMYKVQRGNTSIKVWDLGGQQQFRNMWERYCRKNNAIVFMVDAADRDKFPQAKEQLTNLLKHENLQGISLLVLANKADLDEAASCDEVIQALDVVEQCKDKRDCYYLSTSCKTKLNVDTAIQWLVKTAKK